MLGRRRRNRILCGLYRVARGILHLVYRFVCSVLGCVSGIFGRILGLFRHAIDSSSGNRRCFLCLVNLLRGFRLGFFALVFDGLLGVVGLS